MSPPAPAAATAAALALAVLLGGCGGHDPAGDAGRAAQGGAHPPGPAFAGGVVEPRRRAPPLRLRAVDGRPLDLRELRGRPVLVTFVYASCPDVCR